MWISVSVTPRSVAPFALPGPQIFFRVPKSPGPAVAALEADALAAVDPLGGTAALFDERPQAPRPSVTTAAMATDVATP